MKFKISKSKPNVLQILRSAGFRTQSKNQLPPLLSNNESAYGSVWNQEEKRWVVLLNGNKNFHKFSDKLMEIYDIKMPGVRTSGFPLFEVDVVVGYTKDIVHRVYTAPEQFFIIENDDFHLWFLPWSDGVMIHSIHVAEHKRGNGLGTQLMNFLFDVSVDTNCPIYLVPFPDENYQPEEMMTKIDKLKSWYSKLDFVPFDKDDVIYTNFE
jgi:GNAT superfamily N-acetyltransferase